MENININASLGMVIVTLLSELFNENAPGFAILCVLIPHYVSFDTLYHLYLRLDENPIARTTLLPALHGEHRILVENGVLLQDLLAIYGHPGGQPHDTEYTFVLTRNTHIFDLTPFHICRLEFDHIYLQGL